VRIVVIVFHVGAEERLPIANREKQLLIELACVVPAVHIDLQSGDEIFHTLYDIDDKMQIPGEQYVWSGRTYEKDGYQPKWRAIRDDKGRIIVAICHNMHLGDAWELADDPNYPETFASMAFRVGLDYIIYGMTH